MSSSVKTHVTVTVAGQTFTWGCTGSASQEDAVLVTVERVDYTNPLEPGTGSEPVTVTLHAERKVEIGADNAEQYAGRKVRAPSGEEGMVVGVLKKEYGFGEYTPGVLLGVDFDEWKMKSLLNEDVPVEYFRRHPGSYRLAATHDFGWFTNFGTYTLLD